MIARLSSKHLFKSCLARKISIYNIIVLLLLFVIFMVYDFFEVQYSLQKELDEYSDQVSARLSTSLRYPVWNIDWPHVQEMMHAEMADTRLACLVMTDSVYGEVVSVTRQGEELSSSMACEPHPDDIVRVVTLKNDHVPIGTVKIVMDSSFIWRNLFQHLTSQMFKDLGFLLVLTLTLFMFTRKLLLKPIAALTNTTQNITKNKDYALRALIPSRDEFGNLAHYFNTMLDEIEARDTKIRSYSKDLELEVAERTEELAKKAQDLEHAYARLLELDELKSSFLSTVSHDLRTPLTSILGFSKVIAKDFSRNYGMGPETDAKRIKRRDRILKNLAIIQSEGERLTRLINDFLDLSKIESGSMEWRDQPIEVANLVEQALDAVRGQFDELPDVALRFSRDDSLPVLLCDPDRLLQVLVNLLNNAAKFTTAGSVEIKARNIGGGLRIEVADSGPGIPANLLDQIFDKFYRINGGDTLLHSKVKGTGLGLAISREIVQHYKGRIWAESEVGKGSTFFVELPGQGGNTPAHASFS